MTLFNTIFDWIIKNLLDKIFSNKKDNLKIIEVYEERLKNHQNKIEKLERESKKEKQESREILSSLKNKGISTEKLIQKYSGSLNAIFISYAAQHVSNVRKEGHGIYFKKQSFIKIELERYNVKSLGGTDFLIPPANVPKWITNNNELKEWFEREISKGRYCKLKLLALIDIRNKTFWENYLPYKQKHPYHFTIGEVLDIKDLFTEKEIINRIELARIIKDGDIGWLASTSLSEDEQYIIHKNQRNIELDLGNLSLRLLAKDEKIPAISRVLSKYIDNSDKVAADIVKEAKFWNEKLKG